MLILGGSASTYIYTRAHAHVRVSGEPTKARQGKPGQQRGREEAEGDSRELREATAMGDSSDSVSVDVERIYFGGKVRARPPPASLIFVSPISDWVGCIRVGRVCVWFVALGFVLDCLLFLS